MFCIGAVRRQGALHRHRRSGGKNKKRGCKKRAFLHPRVFIAVKLPSRCELLAVRAAAGLIERRAAIYAEARLLLIDGRRLNRGCDRGCYRRCGGSCGCVVLSLSFLALPEGFAHLAYIGCGKNAADIGAAVLILELFIDGDNVLYEDDRHHEQLINEAQQDGEYDHGYDTETAEPLTVGYLKQHEEAVQNDKCRREDVHRLQQLFNYKILEVAGVVQELSESIQLFASLFGYDEDECKNRRDDRENDCGYAETDRAAEVEHVDTHRYYLR